MRNMGVLCDLEHSAPHKIKKALTIKEMDFVDIEYMGLYQYLGYLVIKGFE